MRRVLSVSLLCVLIIVGCSTAWLTTVDNILVAAAPALINILNIIAIAEGHPFDAALATKINADAAAIKSISNDFATSSAAAAPTVCAQLQAAVATYSQDETQVLALAQVQNAGVQTKVEELSGLTAGVVVEITAAIPNCNEAKASLTALARTTPPLTLTSFVDSYNSNLVKSTGVVAVDDFTKKHKIHQPWFHVGPIPVFPHL